MRPNGRLTWGVVLASLLLAAPAGAVDLGFKLEPGVAVPLAKPQTDYFGVGGGGMLRFSVAALRFLDVQATTGYFAFPSSEGGSPVTIFALGVGPRLQMPHQGTRRWSLWLDMDMLYIRTGPLDRFGFSIGAGAMFALTSAKTLWLGPTLRYLEIVQGNRPGFDNTDARILIAGLTFEYDLRIARRAGPGDSDGDGVLDPDDKCPQQAGPKENAGCPWGDTDGDGLNDRDDRCPAMAGPKENAGCPWMDTDGDGVLDKEDRCPQVPGPKDNAGCPYGDVDGDGVLDKDDRCPQVPGPRAPRGCPDRDGDGLADDEDACPDVAGPIENKGCPKYKKVAVTKERIELLEKIFFAYNKATILTKSFPLLNEVTQALRDFPSVRVRVEGHTDIRGSAAHNQRLSMARAESVRRYLVQHGIAADRLEAKGYGPTVPIDTNATPQGRERNRRVEFVIIP